MIAAWATKALRTSCCHLCCKEHAATLRRLTCSVCCAKNRERLVSPGHHHRRHWHRVLSPHPWWISLDAVRVLGNLVPLVRYYLEGSPTRSDWLTGAR